MQDERDDQQEPEQDQRPDQEDAKPDPFDDLDDLESGTPFRAWDMQVHAIGTIGELYVNIAKLDMPETEDVLRAIGHALIDLVEDHKPRNVATMASAIAVNSTIEPKS